MSTDAVTLELITLALFIDTRIPVEPALQRDIFTLQNAPYQSPAAWTVLFFMQGESAQRDTSTPLPPPPGEVSPDRPL